VCDTQRALPGALVFARQARQERSSVSLHSEIAVSSSHAVDVCTGTRLSVQAQMCNTRIYPIFTTCVRTHTKASS
jgi:hypothetical protein